jgi:DNA-binding CsgD family transcriptional regulator
MARCVTCGTELHPDRARKYDYCTAPACQERNLKGLTMVAIGMNKAAEELMILDEDTRADLASGKYRDQRRGSFGPPAPPAGPLPPADQLQSAARPARRRPRPQSSAGGLGGSPSRPAAGRPRWTPSQQRLALLYNSQGLRPAEIAARLGVSSHLVTQIILAAKNRGKA